MFSVAQMMSFLLIVVIVGLEMQFVVTLRTWQSPVLGVGLYYNIYVLACIALLHFSFIYTASNLVSINVGSVVGAIAAATIIGGIVAILVCIFCCACGGKE